MNVVLALGNPGSRYEQTRHNIGWLVADAVVERLRGAWGPGRGDFYVAEVSWRGRKAAVVKPTTYMNLSGNAAVQALRLYDSTPAEMLVLVDEIQFPTGRIQLKGSGSDGGHNGLASLIFSLDTLDFPRLRCGVGRDFGPGGMADYVLSPFPNEERVIVEEMIAKGRDAVMEWIANGTSRAMNMINRAGETKGGAEKKEEGGGISDTTEQSN